MKNLQNNIFKKTPLFLKFILNISIVPHLHYLLIFTIFINFVPVSLFSQENSISNNPSLESNEIKPESTSSESSTEKKDNGIDDAPKENKTEETLANESLETPRTNPPPLEDENNQELDEDVYDIYSSDENGPLGQRAPLISREPAIKAAAKSSRVSFFYNSASSVGGKLSSVFPNVNSANLSIDLSSTRGLSPNGRFEFSYFQYKEDNNEITGKFISWGPSWFYTLWPSKKLGMRKFGQGVLFFSPSIGVSFYNYTKDTWDGKSTGSDKTLTLKTSLGYEYHFKFFKKKSLKSLFIFSYFTAGYFYDKNNPITNIGFSLGMGYNFASLFGREKKLY